MDRAVYGGTADRYLDLRDASFTPMHQRDRSRGAASKLASDSTSVGDAREQPGMSRTAHDEQRSAGLAVEQLAVRAEAQLHGDLLQPVSDAAASSDWSNT